MYNLVLTSTKLFFYRFIRGHYGKLPRIQSITGLMLFSLVIPVALLSLFPHQEARFIIPALVPLVYLYGNRLHPNETDGPSHRKLKRILLCTWFIVNASLTVFYGFIHQGGIYSFANTLHREIKATYGVHTYVISTHSYSIPSFLLQLESTTKIYKDRKSGHKYRLTPSTFLYKYGSMPMDELFSKVDDVLTNAEMLLHEYKKQYRFYVATPCSLEAELEEAASKYYYFKLLEDYRYYPHFCTEAVPRFPGHRDQYCFESNLKANESRVVDLNIFQRISCYFKRFCLKVYRVKPVTKFDK